MFHDRAARNKRQLPDIFLPLFICLLYFWFPYRILGMFRFFLVRAIVLQILFRGMKIASFSQFRVATLCWGYRSGIYLFRYKFSLSLETRFLPSSTIRPEPSGEISMLTDQQLFTVPYWDGRVLDLDWNFHVLVDFHFVSLLDLGLPIHRRPLLPFWSPPSLPGWVTSFLFPMLSIVPRITLFPFPVL